MNFAHLEFLMNTNQNKMADCCHFEMFLSKFEAKSLLYWIIMAYLHEKCGKNKTFNLKLQLKFNQL